VDQFPPAIPAWVAGVLAAWVVIGAGVYFCVVRLVARKGGKVSTQEFKEPDLILCCAYIAWIVMNIWSGFGRPQQDVDQNQIISAEGVFVIIVGLPLLFMMFRGIDPVRQFGVTRLSPFSCLVLAAGLILAAHPLVLVAEGITAEAMHGKAEPQNVVEFFVNASQKSDLKGVCVLLVLAVFVAPVAEETIFRGYIYGVMKRYIGGIGAGLLSAGLFAAMHLNMAALPALFVLALCLTLAYEATGSLLVNIFMHGFFNLSMLLVILYLTGHPGMS